MQQGISNEALALRIQNGEQELTGQLWEQIVKFVQAKAWNFFTRIKIGREAMGRAVDFSLDDLLQDGYFAMLDAVERFDPERGFSFVSMLDLRLKSFFAQTAGLRLVRQRQDPLRSAISGDAPTLQDDEESGTTMLDMIPSDACTEEAATRGLYLDQLHAALERGLSQISSQQAHVIRERFYAGKTLDQIAAPLDQSGENIRQLERKGLEALYKGRMLSGLNEFVDRQTNFYLTVGPGTFQRTHESAVETLVFRRERVRNKWIAEQEKRFKAIKGNGGNHDKTKTVGRTLQTSGKNPDAERTFEQCGAEPEAAL